MKIFVTLPQFVLLFSNWHSESCENKLRERVDLGSTFRELCVECWWVASHLVNNSPPFFCSDNINYAVSKRRRHPLTKRVRVSSLSTRMRYSLVQIMCISESYIRTSWHMFVSLCVFVCVRERESGGLTARYCRQLFQCQLFPCVVSFCTHCGHNSVNERIGFFRSWHVRQVF
jgi:hypothetical protein